MISGGLSITVLPTFSKGIELISSLFVAAPVKLYIAFEQPLLSWRVLPSFHDLMEFPVNTQAFHGLHPFITIFTLPPLKAAKDGPFFSFLQFPCQMTERNSRGSIFEEVLIQGKTY